MNRAWAAALLCALASAGCAMRGEVEATRSDPRLADLDALAAELPRRHANLYHRTPRVRFEREVAALRARLPGMGRMESAVELARISVLAGDGHTALFLLPFPGAAPIDGMRQLPLQFYLFEDGLRVIAVHRSHRNLLGARLASVGTMPASVVIARIGDYVPADNDMTRAEYVAWYAALPDVLHAVGASTEHDVVRLHLESDAGPVEVALPPTMTPDGGWMTQLQWLPGERGDWIAAGEDTPAPPWLQRQGTAYWFQPMDGVLYAQVNLLRDQPGNTFASFSSELLAWARRDSRPLVIDLRLNRGGNGDLIGPLVDAIAADPRLSRRGQLYVLVGRRTFSAAQFLVNALEKRARPIFVGEPTGSSPNHYGELGILSLPSGLVVYHSTRHYVHDPRDARRWTPVTLYAPLRYQDLATGHDPALARVLADIAARVPQS